MSDYTGSQWVTHMRSLLGEKVRVVYAYESGDSGELVAYGELRSFTEDGQVGLMDETGIMHWCWPNLRTERDDDFYGDASE